MGKAHVIMAEAMDAASQEALRGLDHEARNLSSWEVDLMRREEQLEEGRAGLAQAVRTESSIHRRAQERLSRQKAEVTIEHTELLIDRIVADLETRALEATRTELLQAVTSVTQAANEQKELLDTYASRLASRDAMLRNHEAAAAERDASLRHLELVLSERERIVEERGKSLTQQASDPSKREEAVKAGDADLTLWERDLAEHEAAVVARERDLAQREEATARGGPSTGSTPVDSVTPEALRERDARIEVLELELRLGPATLAATIDHLGEAARAVGSNFCPNPRTAPPSRGSPLAWSSCRRIWSGCRRPWTR